MSFRFLFLFLTMSLLVAPPTVKSADDLGFRVPAGFEVSLFADDDLAHNIYSMTLDAQGRVVVSGPDYIKTLHDDDGDGQAERASLYAEISGSGAKGMCFDGADLICNSDNSLGRFRDSDGDSQSDGPKEIWARLRSPEHGGNGVVRGPDGWFYVICGNNAEVSTDHVTTAFSPVKQPRCGAVLRVSPDGKRQEVLAHGYRNPYDLDIAASGNILVYDSDGERDHHLPWYAPTRLFDVAIGMEHGWLLEGWQRSWNRPQSFFDNVPRLVELGRGSPTGVKVYRHRQFPKPYRGGVFCCCWTLGRIYFCPLKSKNSSLASKSEIFMQTGGDVGFAPVDLAVNPQGDLLVAIGGRGTRGGVFRVRYTGASPAEPPTEPLTRVLQADQPLAAWSRARWIPVAKRLGADAFLQVAADSNASTSRRIRAIEILVEVFTGLDATDARQVLDAGDVQVTARAAWALSRKPNDADAQELLVEMTHDEHPLILRAAWEGLIPFGDLSTACDDTLRPNWIGAAWSDDRRVRAAMTVVASRQPQLPKFTGEAHSDPRMIVAWLRIASQRGVKDKASFVQECLKLFALKSEDPRLKQDAVRSLQILLGDLRIQPGQDEVYSGYSGNSVGEVPGPLRERIASELAVEFPSPDAELNRELARLFCMLQPESPELLDSIATRWTAGSKSAEDIHYLIVASRLPGERSPTFTAATAGALARLHGKLDQRGYFPSRNWPLRLGEAFTHLSQRDEKLAAALLAHSDFGRSDHSLFAALMDKRDRLSAGRRLLKTALAADEEDTSAWTSELVGVLASLPDEEILEPLRQRWFDVGLRDAITPILARRPREEDGRRFLDALASVQPEVVEQAAEALLQLDRKATAEEIAVVLRSLRSMCAVKPAQQARDALSALLVRWSGEQPAIQVRGGGDLLSAYEPWFQWFAATHPEESARLTGFSGSSAATWKQRLAEIDWSGGDAQRGKTVYEKKSCHRCHSGTNRLGPELAGAAVRFSRNDLFAAIIDPNKNVAPLYRTLQVTTTTGKVYQGLPIYQSPNGTLLQVAPDKTVRITGDELDVIAPSNQSIMPVGLLNDAGDDELADLYAYLRTLTPRRKP